MFGQAVYNFFIGIAESAQKEVLFADSSHILELPLSNNNNVLSNIRNASSASLENRVERISSLLD
jgi:hypothetical protein